MTRAELLSLALKVLGVYYGIAALMSVIHLIIALGAATHFQNDISHILFVTGAVAAILLAFAIAYVLIEYGGRIAKILIADDEQISYSYNPAHLEPILKIALMIIAVWCLARGIPPLAGHLIDLGYRNYQGALDVIGWLRWYDMLNAGIAIAIGILLYFNAERITALFLRKDEQQALKSANDQSNGSVENDTNDQE